MTKFFKAWKMSADFLQCVEAWAVFRGRWRATAEERREKGDFSPVERFSLLYWVITPQEGLKPSEGQ